jgi:hypothetical protein
LTLFFYRYTLSFIRIATTDESMDAAPLPIPPGLAPVPRALRRLCTFVRTLVLLGGVGLLCLPLWLPRSPEAVRWQAQSVLGLAGTPMTLDTRALWLFAAAQGPSIVVALFMLWQLWRLFGAYRRGEVFSRGALQHLRRFSVGVLLLAALEPLARTACILAVTIGNPPGQRQLVINFSSDDYERLLIGAVLLAIASVMAEAVRVAEDNAGFV